LPSSAATAFIRSSRRFPLPVAELGSDRVHSVVEACKLGCQWSRVIIQVDEDKPFPDFQSIFRERNLRLLETLVLLEKEGAV
jgi:hypothetical protein